MKGPNYSAVVTEFLNKNYDLLVNLDDQKFQEHILQGVSRTFALTIPQLPDALRYVVTNAYLLCRTVDTIEDEPALAVSQKREFCQRFIDVVAQKADTQSFVEDLSPLLSDSTIPAEHELVHHLARVIQITHQFGEQQKASLVRCIRIMSEGMAYYQENSSIRGVADLPAMDRYCYYVAGVVGEMLTDLFAYYSPQIAAKHQEMMALAVSFGQGLQMTNILKDIREDYDRSACWLPRDIFESYGFDLDNLGDRPIPASFEKGMEHLLGIAHAHLKNAFKYVTYIPSKEKGIREFCLWAIGMAILTLQKVNKHKDFTEGSQVKISRKKVKQTVVATRLTVKSNTLLGLLFDVSRRGLPLKDTTFKA